MNSKLVLVLLVCAFIAAEAKPGGGKDEDKGRDSNKKPGSTPAPGAVKASKEKKPDRQPSVDLIVEGLKNLCDGLSTGSLTNTKTSFDAVFATVGGLCTDLDTYLASQAVPPARRKRGGKGEPPKRAGVGKEGQQSEKPKGEKQGSEPKDNKALEALFRICKGLERLQASLPADLSDDLASILTETGNVCSAADLVRNPTG